MIRCPHCKEALYEPTKEAEDILEPIRDVMAKHERKNVKQLPDITQRELDFAEACREVLRRSGVVHDVKFTRPEAIGKFKGGAK